MTDKWDTIIWDMDGTTLNTLDDLTVSMNYTLEMFGLKPHTVDEYRRVFGSGVRYAFEHIIPEGIEEDLIDRMLPIYKEHYDEHCLDRTRPYDGILDVIRELNCQGYKQAIVSNKIDSAVQELHERFFSEAVDIAVGERDGIKRKPAPDMVNEALKELGSTTGTSVYIGDSEVDLATAKNSGLSSISVLWGFRDKEFLVEHGAVRFVEKPEDILGILC